jgi:hypothetical protein
MKRLFKALVAMCAMSIWSGVSAAERHLNRNLVQSSAVMFTYTKKILFITIIGLFGVGLANALPMQSENFDSPESAAANGWTLQNGAPNWGWQNTNHAGGGASGEARADTY